MDAIREFRDAVMRLRQIRKLTAQLYAHYGVDPLVHPEAALQNFRRRQARQKKSPKRRDQPASHTKWDVAASIAATLASLATSSRSPANCNSGVSLSAYL